jgi:hypothetical protein
MNWTSNSNLILLYFESHSHMDAGAMRLAKEAEAEQLLVCTPPPRLDELPINVFWLKVPDSK